MVDEVEGSPDFWSGPVQSYDSPVEHRFLIGKDRSTNGPLASMSQSGPCLLGKSLLNILFLYNGLASRVQTLDQEHYLFR